MNQLESIIVEQELLAYAEARKRRELNNEPEPEVPPTGPPKNAPPFNTFMITKTDVQKKVYGAGYPSLPIMTVDELYEQRRAEGIWPGPSGPSSSTVNQLPPEADESAEREEQEDADDPTLRLRQLELDEYKDTHRRGWGNRFNRS